MLKGTFFFPSGLTYGGSLLYFSRGFAEANAEVRGRHDDSGVKPALLLSGKLPGPSAIFDWPSTLLLMPTPPNRLVALLARAGLDWFLLGLVGVVGLAYFFPHVGSKASPLPWAGLIQLGISAIFFFYGLRLSPDKLRAGMRNWRLHVLVQLTTFGLFPLLALAVRPAFAAGNGPLLWRSIFFLCALPSTVSTSVVMVSIARGNLPAAIFNASLSGLLGIGLTPLWTGLVLHTGAAGVPLGRLVLNLGVQVVLPVAAGVLLNGRLGTWAEAHRAQLRTSDQVIILLIVFTAFCESFATGVFPQLRPSRSSRAGRWHGGPLLAGVRVGVGAEPPTWLWARRPGDSPILRLQKVARARQRVRQPALSGGRHRGSAAAADALPRPANYPGQLHGAAHGAVEQ